MKTSVIEVRDMLSVLNVSGVEKRIGEVPGVESVTVDFAAGSATVRYDETRLNVADIKRDVRQSGHEAQAPAKVSNSGDPAGHAGPDATPVPAAPPPQAAAVASDAPASTPAKVAGGASTAIPTDGGHAAKAAPEKS
jgi:Cu2+-exporting ATPase